MIKGTKAMKAVRISIKERKTLPFYKDHPADANKVNVYIALNRCCQHHHHVL